MSNRSTKDASKDILFVPLDKLKKSPKNVRKVPHSKADIRALAASIAALGMLQYPVVEPEIGPKGKPTDFYLVNAGEGRRLAQLLRAKRKEIKADEPIRCILDRVHVSLCCQMHPNWSNPARRYTRKNNSRNQPKTEQLSLCYWNGEANDGLQAQCFGEFAG
jgi:hypothetical protein